MKAAVCHEFGQPLRIEEIDIAAPQQDEIKVKLAACAICHSDIFYAEGAWGGQLPAVYGHEAAGVVESVGPNVSQIKPGDHVVVTLIRACGRCHYCAQGVPVTCTAKFALDQQSPLSASGESIQHGLRTGAFAEYVVVHHSQVVVIPPEIPFDSASLLACGVITGFGAVVNTAAVPAGADVAVIGAGGVGLNCIQGAALTGARTIIALDIADSKLDAAKQFGATHGVNASSDDVVAQVQALTAGRGADYVFVSVGVKVAFEQAFQLAAPAGAIVLVGMPPTGVTTELDPCEVASLNQRVLGSKMGSSHISVDIPYLVSLYQQGRLKLDELITERYALEDINEAIASVNRGEALRNVIVF